MLRLYIFAHVMTVDYPPTLSRKQLEGTFNIYVTYVKKHSYMSNDMSKCVRLENKSEDERDRCPKDKGYSIIFI
ncbi:unnamed protein product [Lasius platythorax]|uniref:Uncharacterized protein n=1 Tax=Lasius platythorax TaxID=488582 RepID=A0AAV2NKD8_9HYME